MIEIDKSRKDARLPLPVPESEAGKTPGCLCLFLRVNAFTIIMTHDKNRQKQER